MSDMVKKSTQTKAEASSKDAKKGTKSARNAPLSNGHAEETDILTRKATEQISDTEETLQATLAETRDVKKINGKLKSNIESVKTLEETSDTKKTNTKVRQVRSNIESVSQYAENKSMRKRKAAVSTKKAESSSKIKTKRLKVELRVPTLNTVSGKVFVIGENDVGQLGFGEEVETKTRPTLLDLPYSIVEIAAGGMHSLCLTESGEVITFGCNDEGALGRLTTEEGSECVPRRIEIPEKVVQMSAGDSHSAALSESGQVYIWGNFRSGDGPMGLMADGLKQVMPVKILNGVTVVAIASGNEHLVCLSAEGSVFTCGCAETGQLGRVSERASRDGGRKGLATLLEPGIVSVSSSGKNIAFEKVWTGGYATFLKAFGTESVWAFGLNNYFQLGYENENLRFIPKQVLSFNTKVISWNQISGGDHHTLALDNQGSVYSMGRNDYGRLGLGENCDVQSLPTLISTLENEKCIHISCGNCVSFAVTEGGSVYSWGMGSNQQLGHGNEDDCHIPKMIEGAFATSWKVLKVAGGGQHTLILARPR